MKADEALGLLHAATEIDFAQLDDIFRAFGFVSKSPSFEIEVYYHPQYLTCGLFTARDWGNGILTPREREVVLARIACVQFHVWASRKNPS